MDNLSIMQATDYFALKEEMAADWRIDDINKKTQREASAKSISERLLKNMKISKPFILPLKSKNDPNPPQMLRINPRS